MSTNSSVGRVLAGAAAGAAGTTALNTVTYLDMVWRARPASSTPEQTVTALAEKVGVQIPGTQEQKDNRLAGLGPLTGLAAGVGTGAVLGLLRAAGWRPGASGSAAAAFATAMLAGNAPMTVLGVTDPREWPASSWVSDVVPHLAYGVVTAAVLVALDSP